MSYCATADSSNPSLWNSPVREPGQLRPFTIPVGYSMSFAQIEIVKLHTPADPPTRGLRAMNFLHKVPNGGTLLACHKAPGQAFDSCHIVFGSMTAA